MAVIKQPEFQQGANGQEIGLDLYFPNLGTIETFEGSTRMKREEEIDLIPVAALSRERRIVKANATEAVIGRTIKGMPLVFDSDRSFLNSTTAAVSFLLPDAVPPLAGSEEKFNPQVNQNLFLAANNTRLPADSFTIYHMGFGKAKSISSEVKNARQIPLGEFNSLWLGLSPVVERRSSNTPYYEPHGNIKIIADAGGEDGANSDVQLISIANGDEFSSGALQNVHTQIYTEFFSQNADVSQINFLEEKTDYYPHLSISGNLTDSQNIFRYYAGGIFSDPIKAYVGLDYKYQTFNG